MQNNFIPSPHKIIQIKIKLIINYLINNKEFQIIAESLLYEIVNFLPILFQLHQFKLFVFQWHLVYFIEKIILFL